MNAAEPEGKQRNKRSGSYFVIAALLLVAMAVGWSVDTSIFLVLSGAAVFFLFLGFWNKPRAAARVPKGASFHKKQSGKATSHHDLPGTISALFTRRRKRFSRSAGKTSSPGQTPKKLIAGVVFFIFSMFFIVTISVIFSEEMPLSFEAIYFYRRAEYFRLNNELDSANYYYRQALTKQPEYPEALLGYGYDWLAKEQYDSALAIFDKALQVDPEYSDARYGKALAYYDQKNYAASLRETKHLMDESPEYTDAVLLAGDNHYMQQRYDSALFWYEYGYDMGERSANLCHIMAYIYDTTGDQEKAKPLYKEALRYDSTRVAIYDRLGQLLPGQDGELYRVMARRFKAQGY